MKIYNKIEIDIKTGTVIYEDSFEYTGPVAKCKSGGGGGGGSSTTTIDKEYNAGMLALSQEQQEWAKEMYNTFKTGINPGDTSEMQYMQNVINANQGLVDTQADTERSKMELEQAQTQAQKELLPQATTLSSTQMSDTLAGIQERAPVRSAMYDEALKGLDVDQRMNMAQSDIAQGFATAEDTARRNAARMGRSPVDLNLGDMATERAKAIGMARTKARTTAEDENFNRLRNAMNI